jgi:hypothetical protein
LYTQFDDVIQDDDSNNNNNSTRNNNDQQGDDQQKRKLHKTRKTKTQIVYDTDDNNVHTEESSVLNKFLNQSNIDSSITKVKETNEEYRKKISDDGNVSDYKKTNFKEAVLEPGMNKPHLTASGNYVTETKTKQQPIQLNINYESKS